MFSIEIASAPAPSYDRFVCPSGCARLYVCGGVQYDPIRAVRSQTSALLRAHSLTGRCPVTAALNEAAIQPEFGGVPAASRSPIRPCSTLSFIER